MPPSPRLDDFASDARAQLHRATAALAAATSPTAGPEREAAVDALFRHLHGLKGAAAMEGLEAISRLAHATEGLAARARAENRPFTAGEAGLVLDAIDRLSSLVDAAAAGLPPVAATDLEERLERAQPTATASAVADYVPAPLDEPHTRLVLRISRTSAAPAARAFIALRRLSTFAPLLDSHPPAEALKQGRLPDHRLIVTLGGLHTLDQITRALERVPDVEGVESWRPRVRPVPVPPPPAPNAAGEDSVRVRMELLDALRELTGELAGAVDRLRTGLAGTRESGASPFAGEVDQLRRLVHSLDEKISSARRSDAHGLADAFARTVRDLSRQLDKPIDFSMEGAELTLDRSLVDAIREPVLHALRNAADHGIEPAAIRATRAKPRNGRISVAIRRQRDRVVVEVTDDGGGFDLEALRRRAVEQGLLPVDQLAELDGHRSLRLAFSPGLSTRAEASPVSGRGVGLDAVLRAVEQRGGTVALSSEPGRGSTVRLSFPATASLLPALVVRAGEDRYAFPVEHVTRVLARGLTPEADGTLHAGRERIRAFPLARLLGLAEAPRAEGPWVVVEREGTRAALSVDEIEGRQELVLQPVPPPLQRVRVLSGAAIGSRGTPLFVLDTTALLSTGEAVSAVAAPTVPDELRSVLLEGLEAASDALRKLMSPFPTPLGFPEERSLPATFDAGAAGALVEFDLAGLPGLKIGVIAPIDSAALLTGLMLGRQHPAFDDAARDALRELGNVVCSAFLNGVGAQTGLRLLPSVPLLTEGPGGRLAATLCEGAAALAMPFQVLGTSISGALVVALRREAMARLVPPPRR